MSAIETQSLETAFEVTLKAAEGRPSLKVRGSGVTTVTFLNPPPASI